MIAYKYNAEKYYECEVPCQKDPLESKAVGHDVWLLPGNSTWEEPLPEKEGYKVKWNGEAWEYEAIPEPKPVEPTEDEKKQNVRIVRNYYLSSTDFTQLHDVPLTDDDKELYADYRQYLRGYTDTESWWEQNPKTFEEWINE